MPRAVINPVECRYNKHIFCRVGTNCAKCGWSPEEFERRCAEIDSWDFDESCDGLRHLTIKKEVCTVGNSNSDPDKCSTPAEG